MAEETGEWEKKVDKIKEEIKVLKVAVESKEVIHDTALANAGKYIDKIKKDAAIKLAVASSDSLKLMRSELSSKETELAKLMGKKPRLS